MKEITLTSFWKSIDSDYKKMLLIEMSEKCGKSLDTVQAWMLGYRKPAKLEYAAVKNYIRDNFQVGIIEEGGAE